MSEREMDLHAALHVITCTGKQIREEWPGDDVCAVREDARSLLTNIIERRDWALRRIVGALAWAEGISDMKAVILANVPAEDVRRYMALDAEPAMDAEDQR